MRAWLALLLVCAGMGEVGAQTFQIDADRARAGFWIRPLWLKRIEGVFPVLEGVAERDPASRAMVVDLRVDVRALQMGRASHVAWAQSAEFFDVLRHPWIRFRSDPTTEARLRDGGPVWGDVTLRGVTGRVAFMLAPAECANPGFDCPVRASGEVRRSDFGMDAKRLALGDLVHLDLQVQLEPASSVMATGH